MLSIKNKKEFKQKRSFNTIAVVALLGIISYAAYGLYVPTSKPATITSSTIDNIATKGVVISGDKQPTASTVQQFKAKPNQKVQYTAEPTPVEKEANAAVFYWEQSGDEGVLVEVRTKNNTTWSDWQEVEALVDGKDGAQPTTKASTLVLANNIDNFQFRINLTGTSDKASDTVNLTDSSLTSIDSRDGPSGEATPIEQLSTIISPKTSAATNTPQVISRAAWGSPEPNSSAWEPQYAKLRQAVVHHTATTESTNSYADMRAIWQYHARSLGWGDIGYHFVVDSKGRIFEGRYQDKAYARASGKEVMGGHVYGHNEGTIGVSAIGDYRYKSLSSATRESISKVIGYKLAGANVSPASTNAVVGHYNLYPTSCPGDNIISQLGAIRDISKRRFDYYRPLFNYSPLGTIQWMDAATTVYKYDPLTGNRTDGPFEIDRRINFADTITKDGVVYYRTVTDATRDNLQAFKFSELKLVNPIPFDTPRYMKLARSEQKINPIQYAPPTGTTYPAGTTAKFTDKVSINGRWYYRTETDKSRNTVNFFSSAAIENVAYETFEQPRYMRSNTVVKLVDPVTGNELAESSEAGKDVLYTQKIYTDRWYYRSTIDAKNNTARAIPASAVDGIPLTSLEKPLYKRPIDTTYKYSLQTLAKDSSPLARDRYSRIKFVAEMTIDGKQYFQTEHDANRSQLYGIPADSLETVNYTEPAYEPMSQPRSMKLAVDTYKVDPKTGEKVSKTYQKGLEITFTTKITVNDVVYLRTEYDTSQNIDRAFPYSKLR